MTRKSKRDRKRRSGTTPRAQSQLNLFTAPTDNHAQPAPYIIEYIRAQGKWSLKRGTWGKSQYGGVKRWTLVGVYDTLESCIEHTGENE